MPCEVWLDSGQSNMEWPIADSANAQEEIAASKNPLVRQFIVQRAHASEPLEVVQGTWQEPSPQTTGKFSAVAYDFAHSLSAETRAPAGVIVSAWGGTCIEPWMNIRAVESIPEVLRERDKLAEAVRTQTELQKPSSRRCRNGRQPHGQSFQ